jgi:hypothetical protein
MAAVFCALMPAAPAAQSSDADAGEVAVFGGGSFGLGAHPVVGGSTGVGFARNAMALFEVAFTPMGQATLRRPPAGVAQQDSRLFDFNLSFHIRVPVRERWAPYAILGGGLLWNPYYYVSGAQGLLSSGEVNFGFHTGGGLRYYIRPDLGIRPECKVIVSTRTHTRFTVGVFYNLPTDWP